MDYDSKIISKFFSKFYEDKLFSGELELQDTIEGIMLDTGDQYGMNDILSAIFEYYIQKDIDPLEIIDLDYLRYGYDSDDIASILKETGYHDKFNIFENANFWDLEEDENGDVFLLVDGWVDFAELFNKYERTTIENVTSEDWFEIFDMYYVNISDFIDDIDTETLLLIKEHIIDNYLGDELDEGGVITVEMLNDVDNLKDMIQNESSLEELKSELETFYGDAYNITAENELFERFLNELKDFFGVSDIDWNDKNKLKIKITDLYKEYSIEYLNEFSYLPDENHSRFLEVISELLYETDNKLSLGVNLDYFQPDTYKVDENLNHIIQNNL